jgi:hypothetical protein
MASPRSRFTKLALIPLVTLLSLHPIVIAPAAGTRLAQVNDTSQLPDQVRDRLLQYLSQITAVPIADLTITDYQAADWSDSCLGLGGPAEICAVMIIPGWHIEVTAGSRTWLYRTDADGIRLRQESAPDLVNHDGHPLLPSLLDRLEAQISVDYGVADASLTIAAVEFTTWDGCYGLPVPEGTPCARTAIEGVRVVVIAPDHVWVYHTDLDGNEFRLNPVASQFNALTLALTLAPTFTPPEEMPVLANPISETLFSVIIDDGGDRYQISVYEDRSVAGYQWTDAERWAAVDLGSISYRDLFELRDRLADAQLPGFDGLYYAAPPRANHPITYTLIAGQEGAVQYDAAIVDQLPLALQKLIAVWVALGLEGR